MQKRGCMKSIDNLIKLANKFQLRLARTDAEVSDKAERENSIKSEINNFNWSKPANDLSEFEAGFNTFLKICDYIGSVPTPAGNPFSIALVGNDLYESDYSSAAVHLISGLPFLGALSKGITLFKGPKFVVQIIKFCPTLLKPLLKPVIIWIGNSITNVTLAQTAGYGLVGVMSGLLEKLEDKLLIEVAKKIATSGHIYGKMTNDKSFNKADAAQYISSYLILYLRSEGQKIGKSILANIGDL